MKKKMMALITVLMITVVTVISGYNMYATQKGYKLTDLALANVEALAQYELEDWYACTWYGCLYDFNYDCHVYSGYIWIKTCYNSRG